MLQDTIDRVHARILHTSVMGLKDGFGELRSRYGVTHVVTVMDTDLEPELKTRLKDSKIEQRAFYLEDNDDERFEEVMRQSCLYIQRALVSSVRSVVLVHCAMGVSRSSACVLNYQLYFNEKLTYETALKQLQKRRRAAEPNFFFEARLKEKYSESTRSI